MFGSNLCIFVGIRIEQFKPEYSFDLPDKYWCSNKGRPHCASDLKGEYQSKGGISHFSDEISTQELSQLNHVQDLNFASSEQASDSLMPRRHRAVHFD